MFKRLAATLLLTLALATAAHATTRTAPSCGTTDVANTIAASSHGDTVLIPAGQCAWSSGVSVTNGITVTGAGSGRIIAYDNNTEVLTLATGALVVNIGGYSPNFSSASITPGMTLRVSQTGGCTTAAAPCDNVVGRLNWMQGTVTSLVGAVLTLNITSDNIAAGGTDGRGATSTHRWLISTLPTTVLLNNSGSTMFAVTEDATIHSYVGGFKIAAGSGTGDGISFNPGTGTGCSGVPCAIVAHDIWVENSVSPSDSIFVGVNRGLLYNASFDASPFSMDVLAVHLQPRDQTAWSTTSFFGTNDTNYNHNFYAEACDYHAFLNATDNDEGARSVFRYSVFDQAGYGTHGADTSPIGQRYFEYYNNTGNFGGYSDGSTFNMNWWFFVRGGTFVIHDNVLPALVSTDYGTKGDANLIIENLQRNAGPLPCWGAGSTTGANYHAPQQAGFGNVTGLGTATYIPLGLNNSSTYTPSGFSPQYVGDPEPGYIYANSRVPLGNSGDSNYGLGNSDSCPASPTPDSTMNYIQPNRDYFNTTTVKPGYTPIAYPNPLELGSGPAPTPPPAPAPTAFVWNGTITKSSIIPVVTSAGSVTIPLLLNGKQIATQPIAWPKSTVNVPVTVSAALTCTCTVTGNTLSCTCVAK